MFPESDFQKLQNENIVSIGLLKSLANLLKSEEYSGKWPKPIKSNALNIFAGLPDPEGASHSDLAFLEINVTELQ